MYCYTSNTAVHFRIRLFVCHDFLFLDQKTNEHLQTNILGEAIFVDDIPSPTNCLHGAFIYSRRPLARVKGLNLSHDPQPEGVTAVISTKDIPVGGHNVGARTIFGDELLFADKLTECIGQPIAFVVILLTRDSFIATLVSGILPC